MDNEGNAMSIIVGDNFEEIVFDKTNDVFVMIYAFWDHNSKVFDGVYTQIAESYQEVDNLVIGKYDEHSNDLGVIEERDGFDYPILMLYTMDNKDGIEYDGNLELDDIKGWLS